MTVSLSFLNIVLLVLAIAAGVFLGRIFGMMWERQRWKKRLPSLRAEAVERSRSVLKGKIGEHLSPLLPDFPASPAEARFIGAPIDYVVFKGMDSNSIDEVIFVEVKSGESRLTPREKQIREVITEKRVRWIEYRIKE